MKVIKTDKNLSILIKAFVYVTFLFWTFLLAQCSGDINKNSIRENDILRNEPLYLMTTRVDVIPLKQFPSGFRLDSVKKLDTSLSHHHHVTLYYPVSTTSEKWNKAVISFINKTVKDYYPEKRSGIIDHSVFEMWVTSFETKDKGIKCKFEMQSFYSGAAHYNQDSTNFIWNSKGIDK